MREKIFATVRHCVPRFGGYVLQKRTLKEPRVKSCGLHGRAKLEVTLGWKKAFEARATLVAEMWAKTSAAQACWVLLGLNAWALRVSIHALIQGLAQVVGSKEVGLKLSGLEEEGPREPSEWALQDGLDSELWVRQGCDVESGDEAALLRPRVLPSFYESTLPCASECGVEYVRANQVRWPKWSLTSGVESWARWVVDQVVQLRQDEVGRGYFS